MGSTSISYQLPLTEKLHKETIDGRGSNCGSHVSKATVKDLAFKNGPTTASFCLFSFSSNNMTPEKTIPRPQRDSKSDRRN